MRTKNKALVEFPDFKGNLIQEGDTIVHPSGEKGKVVMHDNEWKVDYGDGHLSRLSLQVGPKGRAVVKQ